MFAKGHRRPLTVVLQNFKGASAQLQQDKGQHSTEPKSLDERCGGSDSQEVNFLNKVHLVGFPRH